MLVLKELNVAQTYRDCEPSFKKIEFRIYVEACLYADIDSRTRFPVYQQVA